MGYLYFLRKRVLCKRPYLLAPSYFRTYDWRCYGLSSGSPQMKSLSVFCALIGTQMKNTNQNRPWLRNECNQDGMYSKEGVPLSLSKTDSLTDSKEETSDIDSANVSEKDWGASMRCQCTHHFHCFQAFANLLEHGQAWQYPLISRR